MECDCIKFQYGKKWHEFATPYEGGLENFHVENPGRGVALINKVYCLPQINIEERFIE